jgi:glutamyl-tRNA synthetase
MNVRVRFAPSPTGGLHLGGVRTILYNYLFAKKQEGTFVLRIEDTDQNRYVEGAEQYIVDCMRWCGLNPDESPAEGGPYAPYRQSERKPMYAEYAMKLVASGHAYYAFDTPEDLEKMRHEHKTGEMANAQYDHRTRLRMRNSLTLPAEEVQRLLAQGTPYVVRIKMPEDRTLTFHDMIRGEISFECNLVDDKVLLKADGMPTYHLAVVVDDYLMKISHIFRGEEWLPSAPVHLLLWEYLGWKHHVPQWAHMPLILKPDGNGKLSKRDGDRLGFPVYAMNWTDAKTGDTTKGFREMGFLPEAFTNMLVMLGWNPGVEQEIFTTNELVERFSLDRVHKGGAKFDFEKAKWFNHQYIQKTDDSRLAHLAMPWFVEKGLHPEPATLIKVVGLVKERCILLSDFWHQAYYFFAPPEAINMPVVLEKWNDQKKAFFEALADSYTHQASWDHSVAENTFNELLALHGLKKGDVLLPCRIMLVGDKYGPGVFAIAEIIGRDETIGRIRKVLELAR